MKKKSYKRSISQDDLIKLVLPLMEKKGDVYRKFKNIYARVAKEGEVVTSITSDGVETSNTANEGDFIVINQTEAEESYIVRREKFHERYVFFKAGEAEVSEYKPKGKVLAMEITAILLKELNLTKTFYYKAPWGAKGKARKNDFFACPVGDRQVYRIARKEFFETYEVDSLTPV